MSRKPRLLKLRPVEKVLPTLAAKVTGHNIANISYLVSKAAERGGYVWNFIARFDTDGSLLWVEVPTEETSEFPSLVQRTPLRVYAGRWVFLAPGGTGLTWGEVHPVQSGLFEEISTPLRGEK